MKKTFYNISSLGDVMMNFFKPELKRRNFHDDRLLLNWTYIFDEFAEKMQPDKIMFKGTDENGVMQKVLYVFTNDRKFATEFVFFKQQLLERINQYFGTEKSFFKDIKIKTII